MDISLTLSILGIIATIGFGFLSIDLFRRRKYPGKLTLVKQMEIGLFNNIAQNFEEITISYKGNPIKENVIYLKSSIINDGDIDVDGSKLEKTLTLKLEEGLKWIKAKVTGYSKDLICNGEINTDQSELRFNFGLIRKKEHFQFEALVETTNAKQKAEDIYENIEILHRIPNTQKVKQISVLSEEQITKKKKRIKTLSLISGSYIIFSIITVLMMRLFFYDAPIYYESDGVQYSVETTSGNKIELTNLLTDVKRIITIQEFQNKDNYQPYIPNQTFWEKIVDFKYLVPIMLLIIFFAVGTEYLELRKSNKLYNIFIDKNNAN